MEYLFTLLSYLRLIPSHRFNLKKKGNKKEQGYFKTLF